MEEIKPETQIEQLKSEIILEKIKRKRIQIQLENAEDYIADLEEMLMELGHSGLLDDDDDDDIEETEDWEEDDDDDEHV